MPTINISDRIGRYVTNYSATEGKLIPIHSVQKVLEGGRLTTQLLSYPSDGGEPTGYVVGDAWFEQSGLDLTQIDGTLVELGDGSFAFSKLPYAAPVARAITSETIEQNAADIVASVIDAQPQAPEHEEPTEENTAPSVPVEPAAVSVQDDQHLPEAAHSQE